MLRSIRDVHAESSVHVPQVVMVIQLRKRLIGEFRLSVEALEEVIT